MAENASRDERETGQKSGAASGGKPFTLSQLEKTEKPSNITVQDLSGAGAQDAARPRGSAVRSTRSTASATGRVAQGAASAPLTRLSGFVANSGQKAATRPRSRQASGPRTQAFPEQQKRQEKARQKSAAEARPRRSRVPRARRMKLSVTKVSPWSVAKVTFMLSIAMGIIQTVCVAILYAIIDAAGVFDRINSLVSQTGLASSFNVSSILSMGQVISAVVIFSVFEVVLLVLLSVIFTFLYNVVSGLVGGVHVTLGDD